MINRRHPRNHPKVLGYKENRPRPAGRIDHVFTTVDRYLDAAAEAHREAGRQQAIELEQLAEYARATEGDEVAYLEVSTRLHISDRAAQLRLQFALSLTSRLPRTLVAMKDGRIEEFKAKLICDAVADLEPKQASQVEDRVLGKAAQQTPGQLRHALAKAVLTVDPEGAEERRRERKKERRVESMPLPDGQGMLVLYDSTDRITAMRTLIKARARAVKALGGEVRTLSQIEADITGDLLLGADAEYRTIEMQVVLPSTGPAEIAGVGPITREHALELAPQATKWRWVRTDPQTGELIDLTYPSYTPPAALAALVKARDRRCRFPGCTRPATQSEIDHTIPWPHGATRYDNNECLCKRHHQAKTKGRWKVEQFKAGYFQWTSPLGMMHTVTPEPVHDPGPPSF